MEQSSSAARAHASNESSSWPGDKQPSGLPQNQNHTLPHSPGPSQTLPDPVKPYKTLTYPPTASHSLMRPRLVQQSWTASIKPIVKSRGPCSASELLKDPGGQVKGYAEVQCKREGEVQSGRVLSSTSQRGSAVLETESEALLQGGPGRRANKKNDGRIMREKMKQHKASGCAGREHGGQGMRCKGRVITREGGKI